jgi:ferredoxin-NADP reductase
MIQAISSFIDRTTMYRLVLYYLLVLFGAAVFFGMAGILPYSSDALLWSALVLIVWAWLVNEFFAWIFGAVTNLESVFITPLILVLILPPVVFSDVSGSIALAVIAAWAMASKYIFTLKNKHLFNPVAIAAVLSSFVLGISATWWVAGNLALLPFVFIGGLMVAHKLRKFDLILAFGATVAALVAYTSLNPVGGVLNMFMHSSLFFFAFAMLTEPLTMPPTRMTRIAYGILVGALFAPATHLGSFYFSPELALVAGNLFAYFASPKGRFMLTFIGRRALALGIYEYLFKSDRPLRFKPGQYLEWTLASVPVDNRGNRRYFTIASSPEEATVALGVRFYDKPSAFKQKLAALPVGAVISAASLGGDFVMPKNTKKKLAFIAGGIGVTPFASMARHCIEAGESRDAVLLYSSKTEEEVAYREVFDSASRNGWRTAYQIGVIDANFIKQQVPDYSERTFYISGPPGMVSAMKKALLGLSVSRFNIKTDFFPGLA